MKPRFIAGAVCPECGALDRLVSDGKRRRCVSCGFEDELSLGSAAAPQTRLDRRKTASRPQAVRFVPGVTKDEG